MLLPQTKEREYRFKLALRMGLPIFALIIALVTHTLFENSATLHTSFYIESTLLLAVSIYFIFYLIYKGFDVKITDSISRAFSREYIYEYLNRELKRKKEFTLILISIENLSDINTQYGLKNGDKVLEEIVLWIAEYFRSKNIENFPLGHLKGGDFLIGLDGINSEYKTFLELMNLKADSLKVDDIEVKISTAISDTTYSDELDYIVENLFQLQAESKNSKYTKNEKEINPNQLELYVINAVNKRNLSIMSQNVFENGLLSFKECYIKLKTEDGKLLYPKSYTKIIAKLGLNLIYDLMVFEELLLHVNIDEEMTYALNISPTSLRNEMFVSRVKELLKDLKIKIIFILSELEYYSHTSRYNTIINSLKKSGVRIAVDRLGSIHTTFLYLRELNIDIVRFDIYYSNEEKLKEYNSIIEGFNLMAHQKGLKTWIKNIQTPESLREIERLNIDCIEGKELASLEKIYETTSLKQEDL